MYPNDPAINFLGFGAVQFDKRMFSRINKILVLLMVSLVGTAFAETLNFDDLPGDSTNFLPVEKAFIFRPHLQNWQLSADWQIAPDYYLYQARIQVVADGALTIPLAFNHSADIKDDPNFGSMQVFHESVIASADLRSVKPKNILISYQGCSQAGLCYPAQSVYMTVNSIGSGLVSDVPRTTISTQANTDEQPLESADGISVFLGTAGFWGIIGTFLLLGVGLSLTPCVLPMVPILSGIIAGQGPQLSVRNGFFLACAYVLGMSVSYATAGVCVGYFGAGANVSTWLQNPWVLCVFAAIFVVLALAMFGIYELQLPSFIINKLNSFNQKQQGGRMLGVTLMGVLSALVVSPCVSAPLAGALIYISTTGDALLGGAALFALGLGMGVPLLLIGLGGGALIPRAGRWMLAVKSFFGVLLLAMALWLLSRFVPGALMLVLWAFLVMGSGIALGAFEKMSEGFALLWRTLGIACIFWACLMLIGAATDATNPLKPLEKLSTFSALSKTPAASAIDFTKVTTNAQLQAALDQARAQSKPVMIDYSADWCTACLEMAHTTFADNHVLTLSKNVSMIQVDVTQNNSDSLDLLKRFGLFAPPSIVLLNARGEEQKGLKVMGYLDANSLAKRLVKLL